jgi:hypothetical protein
MPNWAVPALIVVSAEYVFAFSVGARVGFQYRIPFTTYMILGVAIAATAVALAVIGSLVVYAYQRECRPARRLLAEAPYFGSVAGAILLSALQISVLTWTKVMLPIASPFWADSLLAHWDEILFRVDPWILFYRFFGWAAPAVDRAYITWAPLKFGTFLALAFAPESGRKSRALVAYFLLMAVVAIGQFGLSSAGPVFYQQLGLGMRFAHMPIEPWVAETRAYLWRDHLRVGGEIGGGISAMPSLHVAGALWIALVWASFSRRLGYAGFIYFGLIAVGSVLLGWHYAVDGIAGIAITALAWWAGAHFTSLARPRTWLAALTQPSGAHQ